MKAIGIFAVICITAASLQAQVSNTVFPDDAYYNCMIKAYASYNQCLANRGDYPKSEWPQVCDKGFTNMSKLCAKPGGSFFLKYVVVGLLYAPPGNASNSSSSDSSTSGSSSTFTDSEGETYKYGLSFTIPSTTTPEGLNIPKAGEGLNLGSGSANSTSQKFSTSVTSVSGFQSKSAKDIIDHS